ncbi:MAG: peptide deformylase [Alphaproteobacteria bacterium]|nr:peptide deformylase [Alphaproteobacteria bacterium]
MAILTVLTAPHPKLKIVAKPVETVNDEIRRLMDDMLETMYPNDGMGLAAPQVGVDKRVIVIDFNAGEDDLGPDVLKLVNPELLWTSEETCQMDEACLSVPNLYGPVERPLSAKIRFTNEHNKTVELDLDGIKARCVQHEMDHLNGILYFDHFSRLKQEIFIRKLLKARRYQQ